MFSFESSMTFWRWIDAWKWTDVPDRGGMTGWSTCCAMERDKTSVTRPDDTLSMQRHTTRMSGKLFLHVLPLVDVFTNTSIIFFYVCVCVCRLTNGQTHARTRIQTHLSSGPVHNLSNGTNERADIYDSSSSSKQNPRIPAASWRIGQNYLATDKQANE